MKSFTEMNQTRLGIITLALAALLLTAALRLEQIQTMLGQQTYIAAFSDAGGLRTGNMVRVDGVQVGKVRSIRLDGDQVVVGFTAGEVDLGSRTSAAIKSENALGSKFLAIKPAGDGHLDQIPAARTDAGISVNETLGALTANNQQIDVTQLARSFDSLSTVLEATPTEFRSALSGVSRISQTISSRDAALAELLKSANSVSGVLAERNDQITTIMSAGGRFFEALYQRRAEVVALLNSVERATREIDALVAANSKTLKPNLTAMNKLGTVLAKYRDNLDYVLKSLAPYGRSLGEAVGSGPLFNAYLYNLTSPEHAVLDNPSIDKLLGTP